MTHNFFLLNSRRYPAASNSERQVELGYNSIFTQTEASQTKKSRINSPLETPLRNLGTTMSIDKFTLIPKQVVKSTKK